MQPALAEVVQNSTLPASAARARLRLPAMMSFPWCGPARAGWPKSSMYVTVPSTGKTIFCGAAALAAAARVRSASARTRVPRAVVRWRSWAPVVLEGPEASQSASVESRPAMKIAVCAK